MNKNINIYTKLGLLINSILIITNKFIFEISDMVLIPLLISAIAFMVFGIIISKKTQS